MAGIEEALERLDADADFRHRLRTDPATALAGYVLYDDDLTLVAERLDEHAGRRADDRTPTTLEQLVAALIDATNRDPDDAAPNP
jgi:hypothetical protein